MTLNGVDDIRNDDNVEVGIFANADPIELSPNREPLANATYAIDQDPRFQARTRGRIMDGVLTTDPVDVRFHKNTNSIYLERPLNDARVQMTLSEDGTLEGYLAGYTPVEELYDFQYAFRNGKNGKGEPADNRLITISSMGQAAVLGHTATAPTTRCMSWRTAIPTRRRANARRSPRSTASRRFPRLWSMRRRKSVNEDLER